MVLASKLGSPVSFQQDKNFHQSFASWVKQGQPNNSSGKPVKDEEGFELPSALLNMHSNLEQPRVVSPIHCILFKLRIIVTRISLGFYSLLSKSFA